MLASGQIAVSVAGRWKSTTNVSCVSPQMVHPFHLSLAILMQKKQPIVIGNEDSNAFYKAISLDGFPSYKRHFQNRDDTRLCRIPDCSDCCAAREVSTVHTDCVEFVKSKYKLDNHWSEDGRSYWDHLWVLSAWRTPWRQAPNFRLEEKNFTPNVLMFDNLGYPLMKMKSLPLEVIQIIHEFSAASPLWRFTAASALPHRLPAASSDQLLTIHLSTLLSWDRGCQPVIADIGDTTSRLPIIRMTIDARGIKKVEQLPEQPRFTTWRTNTYVYVVLHRVHLGGIIAHFKVNIPPQTNTHGKNHCKTDAGMPLVWTFALEVSSFWASDLGYANPSSP